MFYDVESLQLSEPQVIYLDFDGEGDVDYNGALFSLYGITVERSGRSAEEFVQIVEQLNQRFAGTGLSFTATKPQTGAFSTIYVGTTDAFSEYGSFRGIAESVDSGNQVADDKAFVFDDRHADLDSLVETIAHEAGHLVGMAHAGDGIAALAADDTLEVTGSSVNNITLQTGETYSRMNVNTGGWAYNTNVYDGGVQYVNDGGRTSDTVLANGGEQYVMSGGTTFGTIINSAVQYLSGGVASQTILNAFGIMSVVDGSAMATSVYSGGQMFVSGQGYASGGIVDGGYLEIGDGGIESMAQLVRGSMTVSSGGTGAYTSVFTSGTLTLVDGGYLSGTVVLSGTMNISGGMVSGTLIETDGVVNTYGGTVNHFNILFDGVNNVYGGVTSIGDIANYGTQNIYGGVVRNVNFYSGAVQHVFSGGTAANGAAYQGGFQIIYSGGVGNNLVAFGGGVQHVFMGGVVNNTAISSGGTQRIYSGGTAFGGEIFSGGVVNVESGARLGGGIVVGGSLHLESGINTDNYNVYLNLTHWQPEDGPLVNDLAYLASGIYRINAPIVLSNGGYVLAGNTGSAHHNNVIYSGLSMEMTNSDGVTTMFWDSKSQRYTGIISNDKRYTLVYDASGNLVMDVGDRYIIRGNSNATWLGYDSSYTDKLHSGVADGSYYGIMTASETYNKALVMGTSGSNTAGTITLLVDQATVAAAVYAGAQNGNVGATDVTIEDGSTVSAVFCAGSLQASGTHSIANGVSLTVNGGTFTNNLIVGSRVNGGTHTISNGISMTITGGTFGQDRFIYVGGMAAGASANLQVNGGVNVQIDNISMTGGTFVKGRGIYLGAIADLGGTAQVTGGTRAVITGGTFTYFLGGGWAQQSTQSLSVVSAGSADYAVDITVNGGSFKMLIGGGSHARSEVGVDAGATRVDGNIRLTINGGSFEEIHAGGQYSLDTVNGDSEVIFTSASVTVGTVYGNRGNSISGTATLSFNGYSGGFTASVYQFDSLRFQGDAGVQLSGQNLSSVSDWHYDTTGRSASGSMTTWNSGANDFEGDTVHLWFDVSYEQELTLLTSTDSAIFTNVDDLKYIVYVGGQAASGVLNLGDDFNGWRLSYSDNALKYGQIA